MEFHYFYVRLWLLFKRHFAISNGDFFDLSQIFRDNVK